MKALQFRRSIPRYVALKLLAPRVPSLYKVGALLPVALRQVPEPRLPGPLWVRVAPRLSGICGSDLSTIFAKGSPYLAPLTSMPFVLGHELVGVVSETGDAVRDLVAGDRVVLHPALDCQVRGIDPPCAACAAGRGALCSRVTEGVISSGIQTGYCRDTGGGWGESLVAHRCQLYRVPAAMPDEAAVLVEPFTCALHAALQVRPDPAATAFILGCGSIGLLTIAALRAAGCRARIVASARYDHQADHARRLGADVALVAARAVSPRYASWAKVLEARILDPEFGKPTVIGGADVTFDCVASSESIDDAIRFTRAGGTLVLVGMPAVPRDVDWTALWYKELTVRASYAYGPECIGGRTVDTFTLALESMETRADRLTPLVGPPYDLADYRAALVGALYAGRSGTVKTVFRINGN